MEQDKYGFDAPTVDLRLCVECGACEKICPATHEGCLGGRIACYAAKSSDAEIHNSSSSGGVAYELCKSLIREGGTVFGCAYDGNLVAKHIAVTTIEEMPRLQGSKYVQSSIGDAFKNAKNFICQGKKVAFCGTPCQIHGLVRFLGKDASKVLKIEIICHGGASPKLFEKAKRHWTKLCGEKIKKINFKGKNVSWLSPSLVVCGLSKMVVRPLYTDSYVMAFEKRFANRWACLRCSHRNGTSGADLTIGDFWGIDVNYPNLFDDKGVSAVIVRSQMGKLALQSANLILDKVEYDSIYAYNPGLEYDDSASLIKQKVFLFLSTFLPIRLSVGVCDINCAARRLASAVKRNLKSKIKGFI